MAQILRVFKAPQFTLIRAYASQRPKKNHYDTLCISQSSSQKEIRAAFVKLSKKVHPDVNNKKGSHSDFVALNEAYNVLCKEESRRRYDQQLKCWNATGQSGQSINNFRTKSKMSWTSYDKTGRSQQEHQQAYDDQDFTHSMGKGWYYRTVYEKPTAEHRNKSLKTAMYCIVIMICGTILQLLLIKYSTTLQREKMLERSRKLEAEYDQLKKDAESRTLEENIALLRRKLEAEQVFLEELAITDNQDDDNSSRTDARM